MKPVAKLADFFGSLNVVIFSPEDIAMVKGMPDMRRKYLDRAVFSGDASYLFFYHEYFRTLGTAISFCVTAMTAGSQSGVKNWSKRVPGS